MAQKLIFTSFEAQENKFSRFFGRENLKICETFCAKNAKKVPEILKINFVAPKIWFLQQLPLKKMAL